MAAKGRSLFLCHKCTMEFDSEPTLHRHLAKHKRDERDRRERESLRRAMIRAEKMAPSLDEPSSSTPARKEPQHVRPSQRPVGRTKPTTTTRDNRRSQSSEDGRHRSRSPHATTLEEPILATRVGEDEHLDSLPRTSTSTEPVQIRSLVLETSIKARTSTGQLLPVEVRVIEDSEGQ